MVKDMQVQNMSQKTLKVVFSEAFTYDINELIALVDRARELAKRRCELIEKIELRQQYGEDVRELEDELKSVDKELDKVTNEIKELTGIENIWFDENPGGYPAIVIYTDENAFYIDVSPETMIRVEYYEG